MSSEATDIIRAISSLEEQGEDATAEAIAGQLATTTGDTNPALKDAVRGAGWVDSSRKPDGTTVYFLTGEGRFALANGGQ